MSGEEAGLDQLGAHIEQMFHDFGKELSYCVNALGACARPGALVQVLEAGEAPTRRGELLKHGALVLEMMQHLSFEPAEEAGESINVTALPEVLPPFLKLVQEAGDDEPSMARLSAAAREALVELNIPIPTDPWQR